MEGLEKEAAKPMAKGQVIMKLKDILPSTSSSIIIFEVITAKVASIEHSVKQVNTITVFCGTQKFRQFVVSNDVLEFRRRSCTDSAVIFT